MRWGRQSFLALLATVTAALCGEGVAATQPTPPAAEAGEAQPGPTGIDYDVLNSDWNGLWELYRAERDLGREVEADRPIDLEAIGVEEPIAVVYPTSELPVEALLSWVESGGRLFVADDFGSGDALLRALGLTVWTGELPHSTFLRGNDQLPVLQGRGQGELLRGVHQVVANHPAVLAVPLELGRPVLAYDRPTALTLPSAEPGLLLDVDRGEGRVLALADPSILVNFMLDVGDNRALAMNIFDALCGDRSPCRIHLVTRDTAIAGGRAETAEEEAAPLARRLVERLEETAEGVNGALARVAALRPRPRGVFYASLFLALGTCVFLFSVLPLSRPRWLGFSLKLPKSVRSRSEFEWNLDRLLRGRREKDFALPLVILKDEFEAVFLGALAQHQGELDPERRYEPDQLARFARRFAERAVPEGGGAKRRRAEARALRTLHALSRIPSRNSLVPDVDERYSERLLRRLYGETRTLLSELGVLDQYERRTGRP